MKSIYFKNFLATAVMVLVSFMMIGMAFLFIGQSFVIKSHRDSMEQNARTVTRLIVSLSTTDKYLSDIYLRVMLNVTESISGNQIFLTDEEGYVFSCSEEIGKCRHIGNYVPEYYLNTIDRLGKLDTTTDLGGLFDAQRYVFAMPLTIENGAGTQSYYIFVSTDRSTIIGAWSAFIWVRGDVGRALPGAGALARGVEEDGGAAGRDDGGGAALCARGFLGARARGQGHG